MRKGFLALVGVGVVSVCMLFSFAACSFSLGERGDVSSLVTSESAQTETSSEAASSEPSSRPSSSSRPVLENSSSNYSSQMPTHELSADEKQKAYQLVKRLKQADISLLRYYNSDITNCTGFRPEKVKNVTAVKTVTDKQEIKSLVNAMRLDTWYPREQTIKTWAHWAVYIDEDFKIGIIGGRQLRIETKDESYCFEAPTDVFSTLVRDCELVKNPDEQTVQRLIEELKQTKPTQIRYYEMRTKNPLLYYPLNELDDRSLIRVDVDSEEIEKLTSALSLEQWQADDMLLENPPLYYVYFNENIYIGLDWTPTGRERRVSIHTKDATAYYIVPREVYTNIEKVLYRTR
ncbi:MAG: hypothetical protein IJ370_02455 [Oscillospiraceae bacterium]|nr:hypothetical protein [Oscillospiraceae bacterium]